MNERRLILPLQVGVKGRFLKMEAVKRDGSRRLLAGPFDNLITDGGLNRIGTGSVGSHCHVGTGNTAPAVTDTQMQTFVASTGTTQQTITDHDAGTPFFAVIQRTYRFAEGAAEGNLSEVGIGWGASSAGPLFSRELIRDGVGDPTTITVLADEFLDVTYELQVFPPQTDVTGQVVDSGPAGTTHDFTIRASRLSTTGDGFFGWLVSGTPFSGTPASVPSSSGAHTAYTGALGAVTGVPAGTSSNHTSRDLQTYVNNSLERLWFITWGLSAANFNVRSVTSQINLAAMQVEFDPVIPKTSSDVLKIGFKVSWSRAA